MSKPEHQHCPKCNGDDIICHGKRYALYPAGCVAILSVPIGWMHRESTPIDFECRACEHRFSRRTTAALWLTVAGVIWLLMKVRWN